LTALRKQADEVRAELSRLRRAVADAKLNLGSLHASDHLHEANGTLVIATLQEQTDSETAARTLGEISSANEIEVVLTFADAGIGITPEALPHVFESFLQDVQTMLALIVD
jgi:hypothetical protein